MRGAAVARYERMAAPRKTLVTAGCGAKRSQARNGINGRGPRSGRDTVYAGFELDPAQRSTYEERPLKGGGQKAHAWLYTA